MHELLPSVRWLPIHQGLSLLWLHLRFLLRFANSRQDFSLVLLWSFGGFFNSSDPNYIAGYRGVIVVECMRRVQLSLIESQNFDIQDTFAELQSELLG